MPSDREPSITEWFLRLQAGDVSAVEPLFARYYQRLSQQAHTQLPPGHEGGEDVAASAFRSFWRGAIAGRFQGVTGRDDLWRLLVAITQNKVADVRRRRSARKRGAGAPLAPEAALSNVPDRARPPDEVAACAEQMKRLLGLLETDELRQIAVWRMEGQTREEIRDQLGCSLRTIANKLELIRKTWSQELSP